MLLLFLLLLLSCIYRVSRDSQLQMVLGQVEHALRGLSRGQSHLWVTAAKAWGHDLRATSQSTPYELHLATHPTAKKRHAEVREGVGVVGAPGCLGAGLVFSSLVGLYQFFSVSLALADPGGRHSYPPL